jgi:ATP-dependent DNA helicase RecQ
VNPEIRAVLLSATLPPAARQVLRSSWKFEADWLEVDAKTPRYEHDVVVQAFDFADDRDAALFSLIDRAPRPAIIYTTEVQEAADLADLLKEKRGYRRIALFTGNTPPSERKRIVEAWAEDQYELVVATSAFGMGIDKADVRSVIHACLPESPARWYQEIGRASRDRGQGLAACLFTHAPRDSDVSAAYSLAMQGWLSRELAEDRWSKLRSSASDQRWDENGRLRLMVDLDSVRDALKRRKTDYNRGWNMALLTLMQRAGVIAVRAVATAGDQAGNKWDLEVLEPRILGQDSASAWDHVFEVRQQEQTQARAELMPFEKLMVRPLRHCVTQTVFQLIEPNAYAPPCGRCPHCREHGIIPPDRLPCGGLESAWASEFPCPGSLPPGMLLLEPEDRAFGKGLHRLLERLALVGIEQFIVARELADVAAKFLASTKVKFGFVLVAEDMRSRTALAGVPTALLLPESAELSAFLIAQLRCSSAKWPNLPMLVVSRGDQPIDGRRLDQTVSQASPILEAILDKIPISRMEEA